MNKLSPILKWAGGKRQLLSHIIPLIPETFDTYYEPFVGAGAVLLDLQPSKGVINDTNIELMNMYTIIKNAPKQLIEILEFFEQQHCKEFYYQIRDLDRNEYQFNKLTDLEKAARTIYLNRTCFNGLYRVNKQGFFNTPMGHNSSIQIVNKKGIMGIHHFLNNSDIKILTGDYTICLSTVTEKDFVFLDPPYYPTNYNSFVRYDVKAFDVEAQIQLKEKCDELTKTGVRFIETNSDCEEVRSLYTDYSIIEVDVRRSINAQVDGRRGKELIICNY